MYYVDKFVGEVVKEINIFAAPERYYEYRKGQDGIITETYIVSYNPLEVLDFSYVIGDDRKVICTQRDNFFKENGLSENPILYAYTVPPEWYEEEIAKVD